MKKIIFLQLDNPGVVRFYCVDYSLEITENSDEEYGMEQKTDQNWLKGSCDDLTQYNKDVKGTLKHSDKRKLSKSSDDIINPEFYEPNDCYDCFSYKFCNCLVLGQANLIRIS